MSNPNVAENSTLETAGKIPMSVEKKDAPKKNFLETGHNSVKKC